MSRVFFRGADIDFPAHNTLILELRSKQHIDLFRSVLDPFIVYPQIDDGDLIVFIVSLELTFYVRITRNPG